LRIHLVICHIAGAHQHNEEADNEHTADADDDWNELMVCLSKSGSILLLFE
jgi:hypothetical protein